MSCGTEGKFRGPYISDPFLLEEAKKECVGLCTINATSCVAGYAVAGCAIAGHIPEGFPVNI